MKPNTLILTLFILLSCHQNRDGSKRPIIDLWYGNEQSFGHIGNPQQQVNILGNVNSEIPLKSLYFLLNDDTVRHLLTWGSDKYRLAKEGDFNIEIYRDQLNEGLNKVMIYAIDSTDNMTSEMVNVHYSNQNQWPLPYTVQWDKVRNIQDAVQVVDGQWELTKDGIHILDKYYDRVLAIGDSTWENYEIETSVIFHGVSELAPGPPIFNVCHVAIASRWPGHDTDDHQPNRKWFPLGATSEFTVNENLDSCVWRIFDGEHFMAKDSTQIRTLSFDHKYALKHRVELLNDKTTLYSVKFWDPRFSEPEEWDFQAIEPPGDLGTGSALILAHNTEVTFGNIYARPL